MCQSLPPSVRVPSYIFLSHCRLPPLIVSSEREALINELKTTKQSVSGENARDHFTPSAATERPTSATTTPGLKGSSEACYSGFASKPNPIGHRDAP